MQDERRYWFPAKDYGWGWGPPTTWQGWLVLITYIVALVGGGILMDGHDNRLAYLGFVAVCSAVLVGFCWLKGEPPGWRWGRKG